MGRFNISIQGSSKHNFFIWWIDTRESFLKSYFTKHRPILALCTVISLDLLLFYAMVCEWYAMRFEQKLYRVVPNNSKLKDNKAMFPTNIQWKIYSLK